MDLPIYNINVDKEEYSDHGIFTISLVNKPAVKSNFVYMSEEQKQSLYKLASEEKQEVVGAVLIPNQPIYRNQDGKEFYINFTEEAIEDLVYKMSKDGFFNYFNVEHSNGTDGVFMLEYWIKESQEDKSNKYGFQDLPIGTLFMKCKIEDEMVLQGIKNGEINGFSIEAKARLEPMKLQEIELQSYSDYPKAAKENAQRALDWAEKNGWGSCGTSVGKARANQLAKGEPISEETIGRMASFARHEQHKDAPYSEGCGGLMWDAWGGSAGINWAKRKMEEINTTKMEDQSNMDTKDELSLKETIKQVIAEMVDAEKKEQEVKAEMSYDEKESKMQEEGGLTAEGLLMAINDMINDFMSYSDSVQMKETETNLSEENDSEGKENVSEGCGETSTELAETETEGNGSEEGAVELSEESEAKEESAEEEVELSEEEAEKVLLSEQEGKDVVGEEEAPKEPILLNRTDPDFSKKLNSFFSNLYKNN